MFGLINVPANRPVNGELPLPPRAGRAVRVARRALDTKGLGITCLPRSIAMERSLSKNGVPADVVVGVAKEKDEFKAHAWVEVSGRPIAERRSNYTTIARFRRPRAVIKGATEDQAS